MTMTLEPTMTMTPEPTMTPEQQWVFKTLIMAVEPKSAALYTPPPARPRVRPHPIIERADRKAEWCAALRSGQWRQIRHTYADGSNGRCALGVLYSLMAETHPCGCGDGACQGSSLTDPSLTDRSKWLGVSEKVMTDIATRVITMNDAEQLSFDQIADNIERMF